MGAINSISRSPRAVPLLVQKGFRKEVLCNLLLSADFEAAPELKKLTVAWFSLSLCCGPLHVAKIQPTARVLVAYCKSYPAQTAAAKTM